MSGAAGRKRKRTGIKPLEKKHQPNNNVYTPVPVARACIAYLEGNLPRPSSDYHWIDPSVGPGAFLKNFPPDCTKEGCDVDPKSEATIIADYLQLYPVSERPIVVCGNPPFGRARSVSMVVEFINHSATFAEYCALVCGRSILRDYMGGKIHMEAIAVKLIPEKTFRAVVNCAFVVFRRTLTPPLSVFPSSRSGLEEALPFDLLNPAKDGAQTPFAMVTKWGTVFSYSDDPKRVGEAFREAVEHKRGRGQSTVYFLANAKVDVANIKATFGRLREQFGAYCRKWSTSQAGNINLGELIYWYQLGCTEGADMESAIPSVFSRATVLKLL